MFKFLWSPREPTTPAVRDWRHDPMGHPALRAMSQRALADLPMVAEVPVRVRTVEAADGCRRGADGELAARCAVSR